MRCNCRRAHVKVAVYTSTLTPTRTSTNYPTRHSYGVSWNKQLTDASTTLFGLTGAAGAVIAVGDGGAILRRQP